MVRSSEGGVAVTTAIVPIGIDSRYPETNTAAVAVKESPRQPEVNAMSYIKTKEAAERLNITTAQVTRLCRNGELEAINVSARPGARRPTYRIDVDSIDAFERRRRLVPPAKPIRKRPRRRRLPPIKEYV